MKNPMALFVIILILIPGILLARQDVRSFRYKGKIIQVGDSKYRVLKVCGDPDYQEYLGENKVWVTTPDSGASTTLTLERWIYEMRSGQYPRFLIFKGDRLISISLGER